MKKEVKTIIIWIIACIAGFVIGSMILKKCTNDETDTKIEEQRKIDSTHQSNANSYADSARNLINSAEIGEREFERIRAAISNDCTSVRTEIDSFESDTYNRIRDRQLRDKARNVPGVP